MNRAALIGVSMGDGPTRGAGTGDRAVPLLANRYSLGERLGGGGMAVVYRAFDERLHREVAVKLLDPSQQRDDALQARFEIEARAAAAINHPRVVAVYDVGTEGDLLFIVMECLPGPTLADEFRRVGQLPHARVTTVLTDVLDGLGAAHTQGVLHRDIKPSNVLIDADGRAKLADFGIATTTGNDLTNTGLVIGTPSYLAPERIAGRVHRCNPICTRWVSWRTRRCRVPDPLSAIRRWHSRTRSMKGIPARCVSCAPMCPKDWPIS